MDPILRLRPRVPGESSAESRESTSLGNKPLGLPCEEPPLKHVWLNSLLYVSLFYINIKNI